MVKPPLYSAIADFVGCVSSPRNAPSQLSVRCPRCPLAHPSDGNASQRRSREMIGDWVRERCEKISSDRTSWWLHFMRSLCCGEKGDGETPTVCDRGRWWEIEGRSHFLVIALHAIAFSLRQSDRFFVGRWAMVKRSLYARALREKLFRSLFVGRRAIAPQ
jgi:hypothetical protein